jgi:hypothetical protein
VIASVVAALAVSAEAEGFPIASAAVASVVSTAVEVSDVETSQVGAQPRLSFRR